MMIATMTMTTKDHNQAPHTEWIEQKLVQWRSKQTTRKAGVTHFAAYVGISRDVMSSYLDKGVRPSGKNLEQIGEVLGYEIYDLLGLERPDPWVKRMEKLFDGLSPEARDKAEAFIRKLAGEAAHDKAEKADKLKTSKGKA